LPKILIQTAHVPQLFAVKNIAEKFYPLSRAHERYRQTADGRTARTMRRT